MIREIEWEKGIDPRLMKDDSQIKVRMFDAEDILDDFAEADYKEMLAKGTICSYCGLETATFLVWHIEYTSFGNFMFSFPNCNDHHWILEDNDAHICMGDWASTFEAKWKKDNDVEGTGGSRISYGHVPRGEPYLTDGRISEYTRNKALLEDSIDKFIKECEGPKFYGTRECRVCYFGMVCKVGQYVCSEPSFTQPSFLG